MSNDMHRNLSNGNGTPGLLDTAPASKRGRATRGAPKPNGKNGKKVEVAELSIPDLETSKITLTVKGMTPLIVHKFGDKSRKQMEDKQQGKAQHKKEAKDPQAEFRSSLYVINEKKGIYGFPASGFKKAMVSACRYAEGVTMTKALGAFHVLGDLLPIKGAKPEMRTDVVRVGKFGAKTSDIRYRGEFKNWSIDVEILYNARVVNKQTLAHLLHLAGFSVGIGEWRPEKGGQFGMFELK